MGRPPREDRPPEILEAACRAIAKVGLSGLYIRHVAAEAGVSRALVSYYFPTRAELLSATLGYAEERAIAEIDSRNPQGSGPERILRMLLLEIDDAPAVRDNWVIWSELTEAAIFDPSYLPALRHWTDRWNEALTGQISDGKREGSIPDSVPAKDAAVRLTALVDGLGLRWLLGNLSAARAHDLIRSAVATELHL
jgi:AcrR family transcriptional regulator